MDRYWQETLVPIHQKGIVERDGYYGLAFDCHRPDNFGTDNFFIDFVENEAEKFVALIWLRSTWREENALGQNHA